MCLIDKLLLLFFVTSFVNTFLSFFTEFFVLDFHFNISSLASQQNMLIINMSSVENFYLFIKNIYYIM